MEGSNLCMRCMTSKPADAAKCPKCGFDESQQVADTHHLPLRTVLKGQYLVGCVLGEGGFGITYIGWDLFLHIPIAIKEYFPSGVVIRDKGQHTVSVFAGKDEQFFLQGRERFFREAQKVAKFDTTPGVVSVKNCFLENGTAYIIMEYISGTNLGVYAAQKGGRLSLEETLQLLRTPLETLEELHKASTYHRDISPENLMLSETGVVKLIDFGSALDNSAAHNTRMLVVRSGYSPVEMYSNVGEDGPYSDVYSMAATIYKLTTGVTPPMANDRRERDTLVPPRQLGVKDMTERQQAALLKGLSVQPEDRYQDVASFARDLYGKGKPLPQREKKPKKAKPRSALIAACCVLAVLLGGGVYLLTRSAAPTTPVVNLLTDAPTQEPTAEPTEAPTSVPETFPVLGEALRAWLNVSPQEQLTAEQLATVGGVIVSDDGIRFLTVAESTEDAMMNNGGSEAHSLIYEHENDGPSRRLIQQLDLSEAAQLPNLQFLYVQHRQVTNVAAIADLMQLWEVCLDDTGLTNDDMQVLYSLNAIRTISVPNNRITSLAGLSKAPDLFALILDGNAIEDFSGLQESTAVAQLRLANTGLHSLEPLIGSRVGATMDFLAIDRNDLTDLTPVAQFPNLMTLALGMRDVPLDLSALSGLRLENLQIYDTPLSSLSFLTGLPRLKALFVGGCGVTSDMLPEIGVLHELTELHLTHNKLTTLDTLPLDSLPALRSLSLDGNYLDVDSLPRREGLNLYGDYRIGDDHPEDGSMGQHPLCELMPLLSEALRECFGLESAEELTLAHLQRVTAVRITAEGCEVQAVNIGDYLGNDESWMVSDRYNSNDRDFDRDDRPYIYPALYRDADLSELRFLPRLQVLSVRNVQVQNLAALHGNNVLELVYLSNCGLNDADAQSLFTMTNIRELNIEGNAITSLEGIQALTRMDCLTIASTQITDLTPLRDLPIGILSIVSTPVSSLAGLDNCAFSENLWTMFANQMKVYDLSALHDFPKLEGLSLEYQYDEAELVHWEQLSGLPLKSLEIGFTPVPDWSFLRGMQSLEKLSIGGAYVYGREEVLANLDQLIHLKELSLGYNGITTLKDFPLDSLTSLKYLDLSGNCLYDWQFNVFNSRPGLTVKHDDQNPGA